MIIVKAIVFLPDSNCGHCCLWLVPQSLDQSAPFTDILLAKRSVDLLRMKIIINCSLNWYKSLSSHWYQTAHLIQHKNLHRCIFCRPYFWGSVFLYKHNSVKITEDNRRTSWLWQESNIWSSSYGTISPTTEPATSFYVCYRPTNNGFLRLILIFESLKNLLMIHEPICILLKKRITNILIRVP